MEKIELIILLILPLISVPMVCLLGMVLREWFAAFSTLAIFVIALRLLPVVLIAPIKFNFATFPVLNTPMSLNLDLLALIMVLLISFLGFLATLFSISYAKEYKNLNFYYSMLMLFIGSMIATVVAGDLFTLFIFWELMTLFGLFLVMHNQTQVSVDAGIKFFIMTIVGSMFMLLGIIFIYYSQNTVDISLLSSRELLLSSKATNWLLLFFFIGAGVKAGMVPLHTWLPDAHPAAPSPISSLLSGVMIKVGIYLMLRIFWQIFITPVVWQFILCAIGSITILVGVFMALVQHDAKRLLAYHSVSQIGYMILGIGTGTIVGVAGGLFHLMNHALFKGLLFLCIGAVIYRAKTRDLSKLGGLAKFMPITFVTCLIASLSISGVPPFNGFVSKWMIYQGIIEGGRQGLILWPIWLIAATFGSALTLASFTKLLYAIFLGQSTNQEKIEIKKEVDWTMWLPMILLAGLCVVFGVFAFSVPLKHLVFPSIFLTSKGAPMIDFIGFWSPGMATTLILVGIILGMIVFFFGKVGKVRKTEAFIGGEKLLPENKVTGVDFYKTVKDMNYFDKTYHRALSGVYDLYPQALSGMNEVALITFRYIDRAIARFYEIIVEIIFGLGKFVKGFSVRLIIGLAAFLIISIAIRMPMLREITACAIMLVGALLALVENNIKKFILYSGLSQLGYVLLAIGLPVLASEGLGVGIFYLITALSGWLLIIVGLKSLSSGYLKVNKNTGSTGNEIINLEGLAERMPFSTAVFIIGGLSLIGIPPLSGFISKFHLCSITWSIHPVYSLAIVLADLFTLGYILRISRVLLFRETKFIAKENGSVIAIGILLIIVCLMLNFYSEQIIKFFTIGN
ncbi:MAG: NADH-quinone oxidoreductase subunit M [bacterium]